MVNEEIPVNSVRIKLSIEDFEPKGNTKYRLIIDGVLNCYIDLDKETPYEDIISLKADKFVELYKHLMVIENVMNRCCKNQVGSSYELSLIKLKYCNVVEQIVSCKNKSLSYDDPIIKV